MAPTLLTFLTYTICLCLMSVSTKRCSSPPCKCSRYTIYVIYSPRHNHLFLSCPSTSCLYVLSIHMYIYIYNNVSAKVILVMSSVTVRPQHLLPLPRHYFFLFYCRRITHLIDSTLALALAPTYPQPISLIHAFIYLCVYMYVYTIYIYICA